MSQPSESQRNNPSRSHTASEKFPDEATWQPTTDLLKTSFDALASLRLTVALLGMGVFIVLAGTLGQVDRDVWDVIHDYFRMDLSEDYNVLFSFSLFDRLYHIPKPVTWIDLKILFPKSFFEGQKVPKELLSDMFAPARLISSLVLGLLMSSMVWLIPMRDKKRQWGIFAACTVTLALLCAKKGGFWFPKGWTIGALMAVNLLAAHLIRFKVQAKGTRLWAGFGVIALGVLVTMAVISSGSNKADSNMKLLEISGTPSGGTYKLTVDYPFGDSFSDEFAYDATSADIENKLRQHEGLENLEVTTKEGDPPNVIHQFVFDKDAEEIPNLNVDITQLTGGTPAKS
ncbi:MAG: hypothetical protein KDA84_29225, partial [Planctomycetaceae bacterium]|nr:hypothetical protein [Planctomycetaceae bacterium]